MYRVGEFSEMTGLSKDTLRYYAKIELLSPTRIDETNKYSYYDNQAFLKARLLVYLRKFDFSIQEMRVVVHECSLDQLEEILVKKKAKLVEEIAIIQQTIQKIDVFIKEGNEGINHD